jgi:hypothetical protein
MLKSMEGVENGRRALDGNPKRQTERHELQRAWAKVENRPEESEAICRSAAEAGIHIDRAKADQVG